METSDTGSRPRRKKSKKKEPIAEDIPVHPSHRGTLRKKKPRKPRPLPFDSDWDENERKKREQ